LRGTSEDVLERKKKKEVVNDATEYVDSPSRMTFCILREEATPDLVAWGAGHPSLHGGAVSARKACKVVLRGFLGVGSRSTG